jgi:origin recognition complex subunit 5
MQRAADSCLGYIAFCKYSYPLTSTLPGTDQLSLQVRAAASRNIILHGLEATGKSSITEALLEELSTEPEATNGTVNGDTPQDTLRYAIVKSAECITGRHLLEQTFGAVAKAVEWKGSMGRCDSLSQLVVELSRLLSSWTTSDEDGNRRFVLVFDGIDRQRDAPPTLLPALARLGEIVRPSFPFCPSN